MQRVLVIGASGFLGRHVALGLLERRYAVRASARNVARVRDVAKAGCEIVSADITDATSLGEALASIDAVYLCIYTLAPQRAEASGRGFMDVELAGLRNVVAACTSQGVRRLIYVTLLGASADAPSEWIRGRWAAEQLLLQSGLDVTVIRPGQVVGRGGLGFDTMVRQAKNPIRIDPFGSGRQRMRNIALDDLMYYLIGVLEDSRTFGRCYDVGCDDVLTHDQMIDVAAEVLGRRRPLKIELPRSLVRSFSPLVEKVMRLPRGAVEGVIDSFASDMVGDPLPIRAILPRPPLSYRQAIERALRPGEDEAVKRPRR